MDLENLERLKKSLDFEDPWFQVKNMFENLDNIPMLDVIDKIENTEETSGVYTFGNKLKNRFEEIENFLKTNRVFVLVKNFDKKIQWVDFDLLLKPNPNKDEINEIDEDFKQLYDKNELVSKGEKNKIGNFIKDIESIYKKKLNLFKVQFEKILSTKLLKPFAKFEKEINNLYTKLKDTSDLKDIQIKLYSYLFKLGKEVGIKTPVISCYEDDENTQLKITNTCSYKYYNDLLNNNIIINYIEYHIIQRLINLCKLKLLTIYMKYVYRSSIKDWSKNWIDLLRLRLCLETDFEDKCFENKEDYDNFLEKDLALISDDYIKKLWNQYYSFQPKIPRKKESLLDKIKKSISKKSNSPRIKRKNKFSKLKKKRLPRNEYKSVSRRLGR